MCPHKEEKQFQIECKFNRNQIKEIKGLSRDDPPLWVYADMRILIGGSNPISDSQWKDVTRKGFIEDLPVMEFMTDLIAACRNLRLDETTSFVSIWSTEYSLYLYRSGEFIYVDVVDDSTGILDCRVPFDQFLDECHRAAKTLRTAILDENPRLSNRGPLWGIDYVLGLYENGDKRRIEFYATDNDENMFMEFLNAEGKVDILTPSILKSRSERLGSLPGPMEIIELPFEAPALSIRILEGVPVYLHNRNVPGDLAAEGYEPGELPETSPEHYHFFDAIESPVIEFTRPIRRPDVLRPNRLQAEMTVRDDKTRSRVPKHASFEEWFNAIVDWMDDNCETSTPSIYVGRDAQRFVEKGGRLEKLPYTRRYRGI